MLPRKWLVVCVSIITAIWLPACKAVNRPQSATDTTNTATTTTQSDATVTTSSTVAGVEKIKPAPGTGNVQGKVLYNGRPVENVEVKLCEQFNQYFGGCNGKTYTARTDKDGEYVITNVPPKVYEGLLERVFYTVSYSFAAAGFVGFSFTKYEVTADKMMCVEPTIRT